jgi:hypothetical protein
MEKQSDSLHWTDVLFVPMGTAIAFVLAKWIPNAWAVIWSAILLLTVFSLFKPKAKRRMRVVLSTIIASLITFLLLSIFHWPAF